MFVVSIHQFIFRNPRIFFKQNWCYDYYSNIREGWNKREGGAKFAKSLNVEVGINMEGGILWKKQMLNFNKRGMEGGKNLRNQ